MLDRERFEQWLAGADDDEVVGDRCDTVRCPLAVYLREIEKAPAPEVLSDSYIGDWNADPEVEYTPLPSWASVFVARVDTLSPDESVTAAEARGFLFDLY